MKELPSILASMFNVNAPDIAPAGQVAQENTPAPLLPTANKLVNGTTSPAQTYVGPVIKFAAAAPPFTGMN